MSINRLQQPSTYFPHELNILPAEYQFLKNGIPLIVLHNNNHKVIRLDIRLRAGSYFQNKAGVALATVKTLFEGSTSHSHSEIFNTIDFQGAYIDRSVNKDFATISIHMPKYAVKDILDTVKELFTSPSFPESELTLFKERQKQSLAVNLEKTSVLAFRHFTQTAFKSHPYGDLIEIQDYDAIERQDIITFFDSLYKGNNMCIFIAGDIDQEIKLNLNKTLGEIQIGTTLQDKETIFSSPLTVKKTILKPDVIQSSFCIGKKLFTLNHPDWPKLCLLNMVLGGYFGSRLMSEIREKRGLAYGIYSRMTSYQHAGLFYISADVNIDKTNQAIDEIYKILEKLTQELIPQEELTLVKNYYYGIMLREFDGIFSLLDRYIEVNDYGLQIDYWEHFLRIIRETSSEELLDLAKRYLNPQEMIEIVVGKK